MLRASFRRPAWAGAAALWVLVCAVGASAGPVAYVSSAAGLRRVDLGSGRVEFVGELDLDERVVGLAFSPSGELFGTGSLGSLYRIDPATARVTFVGETGLSTVEGLDFDGDTLVGSDFERASTLYGIDTSTAGLRQIVTESNAVGVVRALAVIDATSVLVGGERQDGAVDRTVLRRVDLRTGSSTVLSEVTGVGVPGQGFASQLVTGMDFDADGMLYGVAGGGTVVRIDSADGSVTLIADTGPFNLGFAIAPREAVVIPLPRASVVAVPGALLVGAALWYFRRPGRSDN